MTTGKTYSFTSKAADELIQKYIDAGGNVVQIQEGSLAIGDWVLYSDDNPRLYAFAIREVYLNEWSSDVLITRYKTTAKLPRRLMRRVEAVLSGEGDEGRDDGEPIVYGVRHFDTNKGRMCYGW